MISKFQQDFIDGEIDRNGRNTDGTWYDKAVDDDSSDNKFSSQFSEGGMDPYEVSAAKRNFRESGNPGSGNPGNPGNGNPPIINKVGYAGDNTGVWAKDNTNNYAQHK